MASVSGLVWALLLLPASPFVGVIDGVAVGAGCRCVGVNVAALAVAVGVGV